jgi:hypothetical protein
MHADNVRPHTIKLSAEFFEDNRVKTAPLPPHSLDIAPSDAYLFENAKAFSAGQMSLHLSD